MNLLSDDSSSSSIYPVVLMDDVTDERIGRIVPCVWCCFFSRIIVYFYADNNWFDKAESHVYLKFQYDSLYYPITD